MGNTEGITHVTAVQNASWSNDSSTNCRWVGTGFEDEGELGEIENPMTEDVGRELQLAAPEDVKDEAVEVGGRRSSAF